MSFPPRAIAPDPVSPPSPTALTEDDIRRIVREEIAKSQAPRGHFDLGAFPVQPLPMPEYHYQTPNWSPPVSSGHPPSSLKGVAR